MVNAREKIKMLDFIVDGLRLSSSAVAVGKNAFIGNEETNFISVDNDGAVILVDRAYTNDSLSRIQRFFAAQKASVATLFYKDGKTFFRSASQDNQFKGTLDLSLKNYNPQEIQRMIMLRPEEADTFGKQGIIQYYQPSSERLNEGVVSLEFDRVNFDYSHIDSNREFRPENRTSSKLYLWSPEKRAEMSGDLRLSKNLIVSA